MSCSIVLAATAETGLEAAPISPDWILSGTPEAGSMILAKSGDGTSRIMVWECTAGRFDWHYHEDETVVIISGEVFITGEDGEERRLGEGDMGFFPAGSSCIWRIPDRVRKVAVLRKNLPYPLGFGVRAWHKLLRVTGSRGNSPADADRHPLINKVDHTVASRFERTSIPACSRVDGATKRSFVSAASP